MKIRLFIAIDFPKETKREIAGLIDKLGRQYPQIRWEKTEKIHLTLKFLGWTEVKLKIKNEKLKTRTKNSKLQEITRGIEKSVDGIKPFWFQLDNLGYFLSQSLIVWIGVNAQSELFEMVKNLENEMKKLGFPKEKHPFSPHITIGRARRVSPRKKWRKIAEEIKNFPTISFSKFQVKEVILMKSQLTPKCSIYSVVDRASLSLTAVVSSKEG